MWFPGKACFRELEKYKQEYGHTRVPVKWPTDPKLGKWVSRMRQEKQKLDANRVKALNKLGFDWGYRFAPKKSDQLELKYPANPD